MEHTILTEPRVRLSITDVERDLLVLASEAGAGVYLDSEFLAAESFEFGGMTRSSNEFSLGDVETLHQLVATARDNGLYEDLAREEEVAPDAVDDARALEAALISLMGSLKD